MHGSWSSRSNRPNRPATSSPDRRQPTFAGTAAVRPAGAIAMAGAAGDAELDRQAALILSAMDAAGDARLPRFTPQERRRRVAGRMHYRARAELRLSADGPNAEPWTLFVRDIDAKALGFITPDRLPLGYGGTLSFLGAGARRVRLDVVLTRCHTSCGGWYEGALHFNRPQAWLVEELADWLVQHPAS